MSEREREWTIFERLVLIQLRNVEATVNGIALAVDNLAKQSGVEPLPDGLEFIVCHPPIWLPSPAEEEKAEEAARLEAESQE